MAILFSPLARSLLLRFCAASLLFISIAPANAASSEANTPSVGWWRDAVFYEIFVRSFADASSGPLAGDGIGDLQGLMEHLDYLNDGRGANGNSLGVTALWLMPLHPSPSYHGYDVTDYFAVNPNYGDVALMKRLVVAAHQHGIRVIIDLVLNHCSSEHPWFKQAVAGGKTEPHRVMFRLADLPEQLAGPWEQRVWHPSGDEFYYGAFSAEMPDWNLRAPEVTQHHQRAADFWLREVGVDGFRLDAVRYLIEDGDKMQDTDETKQWLREFTEYCHRIKPDSFVVSENTARMSEVASTIRRGSVDSSFEFDLARATIESIRLQTPGILTRALHQLGELYGTDKSPWSTFLTNHDQERTRTQLDDREDQARLAVKLLFTLPGVPFVYYGEELGMRAAKPDPELRTPMPWTAEAPNAGFTARDVKPWEPLKPDFSTINVATETSAADSMLALYRRLIRLNAGSPALRHGSALEVKASDRRIYAVMRQTKNEVVLVLANFANEPKRDYALTLASSSLRAGVVPKEELEGVTVTPVELNPDGGFAQWRPIAELAPGAVYVVRWKK